MEYYKFILLEFRPVAGNEIPRIESWNYLMWVITIRDDLINCVKKRKKPSMNIYLFARINWLLFRTSGFFSLGKRTAEWSSSIKLIYYPEREVIQHKRHFPNTYSWQYASAKREFHKAYIYIYTQHNSAVLNAIRDC